MADDSIMIDKTAAILRQYLNGKFGGASAVARLEMIGYSADEARQMVDEWASVEEGE